MGFEFTDQRAAAGSRLEQCIRRSKYLDNQESNIVDQRVGSIDNVRPDPHLPKDAVLKHERRAAGGWRPRANVLLNEMFLADNRQSLCQAIRNRQIKNEESCGFQARGVSHCV